MIVRVKELVELGIFTGFAQGYCVRNVLCFLRVCDLRDIRFCQLGITLFNSLIQIFIKCQQPFITLLYQLQIFVIAGVIVLKCSIIHNTCQITLIAIITVALFKRREICCFNNSLNQLISIYEFAWIH